MTYKSRIELDEFAGLMAIYPQEMGAILTDFEDRGLIDYRIYGRSNMVELHAKAHDYFLRGGHVGEFEVNGKTV